MACIISQTTGRRLACNLCVYRKFKCEHASHPASSRPPLSLPAQSSRPSESSALPAKSDPPGPPGPPTRKTSKSSAPKSRPLPKVVIPPLSSLVRRRSLSQHTSQEVDELLESPVPPKKRKTHARPKLPTSSTPPRSASPVLPAVTDYFDIPLQTYRETLVPPILGHPPNSQLIYPELVIPGAIIDHTRRFASRRAAF